MSFASLIGRTPLTALLLASSAALCMPACGDASSGTGEGGTSEESSSGSGSDSDASSSDDTDSSSADGDGQDEGETGVVAEIGLSLSDNPDMTIAPFADIDAPGATETRIVVSQDGSELFSRVVTDIDADNPDLLRTFVWGLEADTTYSVVAEADLPEGLGASPAVEYTTGSLPADMGTMSVTNHDPTRSHDGLIFFSTRKNGVQIYQAVDAAGRIVWYHETGASGNKLNGDVKVLDDGRLMLFQPDGIRIVEPWGELVTEIDTPFHHDLTPLPSGNFLVLGRVTKDIDVNTLGGTVSVVVDTLEEITPDGEQVFFWSADEHLDTEYYPSELSLDGEPYDWTHGNAAYYDAEQDQVLLSARHLHWVVAVNWTTGDVDWVMGPGGDFTLDGPVEDWFYAQHAPMPDGPGRMVVYDNGNERPGDAAYSRGMVVEYDESTMEASVAWEHQIIPQTLFLGDADRIENGNVLMTAGGVLNSLEEVRIIEATGDDASEVVWRLVIQDGSNVYRATHVPSL